jgi:hypothetical protein
MVNLPGEIQLIFLGGTNRHEGEQSRVLKLSLDDPFSGEKHRMNYF